MTETEWSDNEEIRIFQEYLRVPTVHPDPDYSQCVDFLRRQAAHSSLPVTVHYPELKTQPIVVITWTGTQPELPSIILNSHMDVVPVFEEYWTHPPFAAEIDSDGRIFARGAQDMKCVGMQYLAAIRSLRRDGIRLKRTIHVTFVPDEERGGYLGMEKFVATQVFKDLNIGFALDEGIASPDDTFPVFYAERTVWVAHIKCHGTSGHGSLLHENTAAEKVQYIINQFMNYRDTQVLKLKSNAKLTIGDVTTVNLTTIQGGVQNNVVPPVMTIGFDIRIAIDVDHIEFEAMINKWCSDAGDNIEICYISKEPFIEPTKIDETNTFWVTLRSVLEHKLNLKIKPLVFPGGTDSRYLRKENIPVIGFSPMNNTPVLLHEHDEFLKASTYLRGISIYTKVIAELGNV